MNEIFLALSTKHFRALMEADQSKFWWLNVYGDLQTGSVVVDPAIAILLFNTY